MSKGRAIAAAMAGALEGESSKLTDDAVVLLEQQYGPLDRNLPNGGSFGELSLADAKLARRNATIIAAEPASLIRIDKQLYRKTLYEMQVGHVQTLLTHGALLYAFCRGSDWSSPRFMALCAGLCETSLSRPSTVESSLVQYVRILYVC